MLRIYFHKTCRRLWTIRGSWTIVTDKDHGRREDGCSYETLFSYRDGKQGTKIRMRFGVSLRTDTVSERSRRYPVPCIRLLVTGDYKTFSDLKIIGYRDNGSLRNGTLSENFPTQTRLFQLSMCEDINGDGVRSERSTRYLSWSVSDTEWVVT